MAAILAARREVTVDVSTQRYADTDQIAYRGSERVDIVVNDGGDTNSLGPHRCIGRNSIITDGTKQRRSR